MEHIQIKGIRNGIKIVIDPEAKISNIIFELGEKLNRTKDALLVSSELTVYVECTDVSHKDKCKIQNKIFEVLGNELLVSFDEKTSIISPASVFHKGTLRSGQNVQSNGHLIVLGDVNPGAEIEAVGNVVVLGALKGIVHAGADGDRNACVCALSMAPTQVRIGDIITRSPDGAVASGEPEMAYVKDDRIYIDAIIKK